MFGYLENVGNKGNCNMGCQVFSFCDLSKEIFLYVYVYVLEIWCMKLFIWVIGQVAERQVSTLCMEAQECIVMNKWLELASLMLTSADLIFSKVSDKGANARFCFIFFFFFFFKFF